MLSIINYENFFFKLKFLKLLWGGGYTRCPHGFAPLLLLQSPLVLQPQSYQKIVFFIETSYKFYGIDTCSGVISVSSILWSPKFKKIFLNSQVLIIFTVILNRQYRVVLFQHYFFNYSFYWQFLLNLFKC